ncbi:MAG: TylF/MycF/NovP-related O-methyltransferase [Candidatus Sulfotelmatobacter sp.]
MFFPTYPPEIAACIERHSDDIRYASIALAIQRLEQERLEGAFAELGVYQGVTSAFIHRLAPARHLYLFDTFAGFPAQALEAGPDERFKDTSQQAVAATIGDMRNVEFRPGYFPETAAGLEHEKFAFVMLDFDLYCSAVESLKFFYPRLVRGGYFFMHDFNSPESNRAIARAALEFLADKPELMIELPDQSGSAVFRKTS